MTGGALSCEALFAIFWIGRLLTQWAPITANQAMLLLCFRERLLAQREAVNRGVTRR